MKVAKINILIFLSVCTESLAFSLNARNLNHVPFLSQSRSSSNVDCPVILNPIASSARSRLSSNWAPLYSDSDSTLDASVATDSEVEEAAESETKAEADTNEDDIVVPENDEQEDEDGDSDDAVSSESEAAASTDEEMKIYIGNLVFDLDKYRVQELFESHGVVTDVFLPTNRVTGQSRGFGFVTMPNREEALKAIEALNESEVEGRTVYVNEAGEKSSRPPRQPRERNDRCKLYVGNLSFYTEPQDLAEYFEQYGPVHDCYIPTDRDSGRSRGFAFVTMDPSDAEIAIENLDGREFDGRTLKVNKSLPKGEKGPRRVQSYNRDAAGTKLYIGNLPFDTEEGTIRSIFEEYGTVLDCFLPMDRETGRPRGFAFVTMAPEDAEKAAMDMDGYELDGRVIRVSAAQPRREPRSGGYGNSWGDDDNYDGDSWDNENQSDDSWGNDSY